jgi:hypothetical protein
MSAPTTMCLLMAAWPTVSVALSATSSAPCGPPMKVAARSSFVVTVQRVHWEDSSRVEASCPEYSGCLVVKQGTSVVWKTGNEISKKFTACILKENKCQFL